MSGPKVVRIVTREEVIAICEGELARLDTAFAAWRRACESSGLADEREIADFEARRDAIRALLARDAFEDLQKQAPREVEFLRGDLARRRGAAAEAAAAARSKRRRLAGAAAALINALDKSGTAVPDELAGVLADVRCGAVVDGAEAVISRGFALLAPTARTEPSIGERQREIARRLGEGEATETLAGWLAGRPSVDDERGREVDRRIAALELAEGGGAARPFAERAASIAAEPSPSRRMLLADSLILDLAADAKTREERMVLVTELEELVAALSAFGTTASEQVAATTAAIAGNDVATMRSLAPELRKALEAVQAQRAANARRSAVLTALARLGYEARDGMETAWAEDGSIVLRKPATGDLGVKLSGGRAEGPLQLRPVRFGAARSAEADRDAEVMWCGDFRTLKDTLSEMEAELTIVQATPVGAVRLEVVGDQSTDRDRAFSRRPKIDRTLD